MTYIALLYKYQLLAAKSRQSRQEILYSEALANVLVY